MASVIESEISVLLDTYLAAFNKGDFTTCAEYYHEPAVAITSSGLTHLPARSDLATFLETTVKRLRKEGFEKSEWIGEKRVEVLEDDGEKGLVMVKCGCKRVREDGTSIEEFGVAYTLRRVVGRWEIISIHQYPLKRE